MSRGKNVSLVDLAIFRIHINNPGVRCCRCGTSVRDWSQAVYADELCRGCARIRNPRSQRMESRHAVMFYRPRTVYALEPGVDPEVVGGQRLVWPYDSCIVKIDGDMYVGRSAGDHVMLFHDGQLIRQFGLQISVKQLSAILKFQRNNA